MHLQAPTSCCRRTTGPLTILQPVQHDRLQLAVGLGVKSMLLELLAAAVASLLAGLGNEGMVVLRQAVADTQGRWPEFWTPLNLDGSQTVCWLTQ
jgi:hypothetical protein